MNTLKDIQWAFFYLIIAVLLGFALRMAYLTNLFFNFSHITHTHSHIGLLGWMYTILTSFVAQYFLKQEDRIAYRKLFICTQISILGMLLTFPIGGYFVYSIIFSSLFILCSYAFGVFFIRRSKKFIQIRFSLSKSVDLEEERPLSLRFARWGIFFLIISSLGIWALPITIKMAGKGSDWYNSVIYFFLHFLYNGGFIGILVALLVGEIERMSLLVSKQLVTVYYCFIAGTLGSVTLSWLAFFEIPLLYIIGNVSAFLLLISVFLLYTSYLKLEKPAFLMRVFLFLWSIKTFFMFLASFPWISKWLMFNRDFTISYLHFTFLGVIAAGVLHFLERLYTIRFPQWSISLYASAFIGSELLITYKGIASITSLFIPANYFLLLGVISSLFAIAVGTWTYLIFRERRKEPHSLEY